MATPEPKAMPEVLTIHRPDQLKALGHPLRLRVLEALGETDEALSNRELAQRLGVDPGHLHGVVGGVVPAGKSSADLAPDLTMSKTRLRPEWIIKWLQDPQALMPGTRMPDFFPEAAIPGVLGGNPDEQVVALRNYILSIGQGNQASIAAPQPVHEPASSP